MADNDWMLYDPNYWERLAEEARTIANRWRDPEAKTLMATVIDTYKEMAKRAVVLQKLLPYGPKA